MGKKRLTALLAAALLAAGLLTGCSGQSQGASDPAEPTEPSDASGGESAAEEGGSEKYVIGYTVNDLNDTWVSVVIDNVEQWASEHPEVEVLIGDGASDAMTQQAVVEGWIEMGVDCVCLKPVDYEASLSILGSVKDAGIKYVALQQDAEDADCFVGADGFATGKNQMQAVIDAIGGSGKIAYLAGTEGTLVASEREEGSMEALEANPGCELVAREDGDWLREDSITIVETWITSGIEFDAICAACDEMAIGAILSLQAAGRDDVVVAGIDGLEMGLEQIEEGNMTLTFYADAHGLAYEALDAALALCKGEQPEDVVLEDILVNEENEPEYMALWK